jgi:hypothetical protein
MCRGYRRRDDAEHRILATAQPHQKIEFGAIKSLDPAESKEDPLFFPVDGD